MVALALVYGVVATIGSLISGDDDTTAADSTAPTTATDDSTAASTPASDGSVVVTEPGTDVTTTSAPSTVRVPSAADPAKVLLLGDSEAGGLSPFLEPVIEQSGLGAMDTDSKVSSGLVRKDFYDWPAKLTELMGSRNPDIVIALFGGNDGQPFLGTTDPVDSPEWRAEYARRVAEVVEIVTAGGRTLIWVGVPNAEDESLTANLGVQNEVVKAELANHPEVIFVDAWSKFTGIDGGFAPYAFDPRDGETKPVRSETDGFHLNRTGEEILAVYVNDAVTGALRTRGAAV